MLIGLAELRKKLPIKAKLAFKFGVFVGIILFVVSWFILFVFRERILDDTKNVILLQSESIINTLTVIERENPEDMFQDKTLQNIEQATNLGLLIFIFDKKGNSIEAPTYLEEYVPKNMEGFSKYSFDGQDYVFYGRQYHGLSVIVGKNLSAANTGTNSLASILWSAGWMSFFFAFLVGYLFSLQALSPINRLIKDVASLDIVTGQGFGLSGNYGQDEIGTLARAFDAFLERIQVTLQREKEFTQDVSHELRTPLMALGSSLELLESKISDPSQLDKVNGMRRSLDRMNGLVGELLFLARKSEDAYTEELPMKIFLQDLIAEQYQPIADDKGVTLKLSVKKDFAFNTRAVYLEKVIGNLIKNAIFYTPTGGKVEIIVSPKEIIVKDNGIGMSQEDLMHIWDRFYRVDRARSQEQKGGYGLGLAIVRKIADEQKWKVGVRSELGKGAEFTVRF